MIEFGIYYIFQIFSIALINFIPVRCMLSRYYVHLSFCYLTVTTVTCNPGRQLLRICEMTEAYFLMTQLKMVPPEIVWIVLLMGPF